LSILAISGGTGFVGSRLIALATAAGHQVRALTRREQAAREHIDWVAGDLGDTAALARLCEGADAVIHVAGVVNAPDRDGFAVGNIHGTRNMLAAAEAAGV
jgi:nucleoside-diphosphate-sugar epimerase